MVNFEGVVFVMKGVGSFIGGLIVFRILFCVLVVGNSGLFLMFI